MKKLLFILVAVVMVMATSCKKEKFEPNTPKGDNPDVEDPIGGDTTIVDSVEIKGSVRYDGTFNKNGLYLIYVKNHIVGNGLVHQLLDSVEVDFTNNIDGTCNGMKFLNFTFIKTTQLESFLNENPVEWVGNDEYTIYFKFKKEGLTNVKYNPDTNCDGNPNAIVPISIGDNNYFYIDINESFPE